MKTLKELVNISLLIMLAIFLNPISNMAFDFIIWYGKLLEYIKQQLNL